MQKKVRKAVIPAAGLGTRFLPATKAQPKEMLPIVDKPTLQYIIEEAVASGIEEILIITGRNKKSIEDHFDKSVELELELENKGKKELLEIVQNISNMINIHYIRQKEPRGLGDAIYCARHFIGDEPFAVMLGDDIVDNEVPCLKQLMNVYEEYRTTILGVQTVDDEDTDYRDMMEKLIRQRKKLCPVKMEYSRVLDEKIIHNLCKELNLNHEQIYYSESPLELSFVFGLHDALRNNKNLFYERHIQKNPSWYVSGKPVISQVEEADRFISYPYESMQPFIRMLQEAGEDEKVVSIKMTLYRVAKNSQIVESLISAAENGKEVVVLVELRARFDEENNIEWSRRLEDAGCRIIYGLDYTKVHSKLCLITYREEGQIKYVTQIGTGNYNEKTSKLYTDLSIITANKQIGMEAAYVFTRLCMGEFVDETNYLLVAPKCMKSKILNYMDKEIEIARAGGKAYVGAKINSLTDKEIIDKLIECSRAGVRVEMIVRGICCLIPGVKGHTENISVISIVGRYLEHSRVYIFGTPDRDNIYISSADFMTRNMERRVEIAAPIYDDSIKTRIRNMFHIMECDTVKARQLCSDGNYVHRTIADIKDFTDEEWEQASEGLRINSQEYFAAR